MHPQGEKFFMIGQIKYMIDNDLSLVSCSGMPEAKEVSLTTPQFGIFNAHAA